MNYELFYANLQRRPVLEIKECMHRIIGLVRFLSDEEQSSEDPDSLFRTVDKVIMNASQVKTEIHRLRTSESLWIQQAVYSKFGSQEKDLTSPQDLAMVTAPLFTKRAVMKFVSSMNKSVNQVKLSLSVSSLATRPPRSRSTHESERKMSDLRVNRERSYSESAPEVSGEDATSPFRRLRMHPSPPLSPFSPVSPVSATKSDRRVVAAPAPVSLTPRRDPSKTHQYAHAPSRAADRVDMLLRPARKPLPPSPKPRIPRHEPLVQPYPQKMEYHPFPPPTLRPTYHRQVHRLPKPNYRYAHSDRYAVENEVTGSDSGSGSGESDSCVCSTSSGSSANSEFTLRSVSSNNSESVASFATLVYTALQREALCREIFGTSEVPSSAVHYALRR